MVCPLVVSLVALVISAGQAHAAVTASVTGNVLSVTGDAADDSITLRLVSGNTAQVEVLDGAALVGTFARATFQNIVVTGSAGNDTILIADINGVFTDVHPTTLDGGNGNDTMTGGAGGETLIGGAGDDVLVGLGGVDVLQGADGNDTLTGGSGGAPGANEQHLGGAGDDLMIWNPGDGNDLNEGGDGNDTLQFNGSAGNEIMAATPAAPRVTFTRNIANIIMDIGTTEKLVVNALAGNDSISGSTGLNGLILLTFDGGEGDDALTGGDGPDVLLGGPGLDVLSGNAGNDTLTGGPGGAPGANEQHLGGPGDDLMIWNPGDGNDLNEGGDGNDTLQFNGSGGDEIMAAVANGARVTFTRNIANIIMDIGTTENLVVNALAGTDTISVGPNLASLNITIDGGAGTDSMTFDAQNQPVSLLANSIVVGGQIRVTHVQVENVNVLNAAGNLPTITITSPTSDPTTPSTAPFITLAGTAADAEGIASVTWVNDRGGSGAATGTTSWTAANIPLQSGANVISVTARDTTGNQVTDTITVTVGSFTYFLSEGGTGTFFDLDILVANPNTVPAPIVATFLKDDGTTVTRQFSVPASGQLVIPVDQIPGLESVGGVSTVITSSNGLPLVVERTMFWDQRHYGAHGGSAVDGPRTQWVFAEGSEGFFHTFVLLANAGNLPASVTLTFLREGLQPVLHTVTVPPTSRVTVAAGQIPDLVDTTFSIVVTSTLPITAERAMYFGTARFLDGGHESAGVPEPATSWFLAEGATGPFFETFVLVGNPNPSTANVTLTFLTSDGQTVVKDKSIPASSRLTVNIETEDSRLLNAAVSTTVTSNVPVVVERAMYWPGTGAEWYEAHNSFGSTTVGTKWGLAEGRVGFDDAFQTFILLANNSTQAADVRITFLRANGPAVVKTFTVNPTSRFNLWVNNTVPELSNETFGALIEVTNGVGIFVERAMYSDALDQVLAAGTNALATRLP
jgi:Ca2+-binding RTX toxin-like protein